MNLPYFLYMAESSGVTSVVNTHTAKINAVINDCKDCVRRGKDPNDYIFDILADNGLSQWDITEQDLNRINRELKKV